MVYDGSHLSLPARQSVLAQKELRRETLPRIRKLPGLACMRPSLAFAAVTARKLHIRGLVPLYRTWLVDVSAVLCSCVYDDDRRSRYR